MIEKLNHKKIEVAERIHSVFQNAYKIEAQLLGVEDFPPLSRSVFDIANSQSDFYGVISEGTLAAVIEVEVVGGQLNIHSLVVDPAFFRRGLAGKLIVHVLNFPQCSEAIVETASDNSPAIALYEKHGFKVFKTWVPEHGIEKVAMVRQREC